MFIFNQECDADSSTAMILKSNLHKGFFSTGGDIKEIFKYLQSEGGCEEGK